MSLILTYKSFLENLRDELKTEYDPDIMVRLGIAPHGKPYNRPALYVVPQYPGITYEPIAARGLEAQSSEGKRLYWVWYSAQIIGLVALTDKNYEAALVGHSGVKGVVRVMEDAFEFMNGNFLSLSELREAIVTWDNTAFSPALIETESMNFYAAAGSFFYKVRLKQPAEIMEAIRPPELSNISSGTPGEDSATITFDTNQSAVAKVKYGTTPDATSFDETDTTSTNATSHSVEITGLSAGTTYYMKPWAMNEQDIWGKTAIMYSFSTDEGDGGEQGGKVNPYLP